jgi:imidazolonepropionase-like amidohydrolase
MLLRGFTTVRDTGGASKRIALAIEEGLIQGPRLIQCGKALSQTGSLLTFNVQLVVDLNGRRPW